MAIRKEIFVVVIFLLFVISFSSLMILIHCHIKRKNISEEFENFLGILCFSCFVFAMSVLFLPTNIRIY